MQLEVSRMFSKSSDFSFDILVVGFMVYIANPQGLPLLRSMFSLDVSTNYE